MFTFTENKVKEFAREAHASIDHRRKYTGVPYIEHPIAVAEKVKEFGGNGNQICAAFLHDVIEDIPLYFNDHELFKTKVRELVDGDSDYDAEKIIQIVLDLTDEYVKEKYPDLNRRARKALEVEHKQNILPESKTVKLCDIIDNTADIARNDKNFARVYLREIENLMTALKDADIPEAYTVAEKGLKEAKKLIKK